MYATLLYPFIPADIVERHNHSYGAGYVDPGRDATVSYGSLDFKFKNPRKYPIKITAYINGGVATVSISGIKEENEPRVSIVATTTATIPCPVNTIEDPTIFWRDIVYLLTLYIIPCLHNIVNIFHKLNLAYILC